ncbi:MAG: PilZ domain-containing protein [Spirochaetaceae bacterium]|jgi:hypothetical protein|nr:PilZ domain-containing protein [Spirochaetaceae bacterium]
MARDSRFSTQGRIYMAEVLNTEALLKNLSSSGLCVESEEFMGIVPKTRYSIDIVPEEESKIEPFPLEIESRWVKAKKQSSESGFVIVIPPGTDGKAMLEQYLAYLSSHTDPDQQDSPDKDDGAEKNIAEKNT